MSAECDDDELGREIPHSEEEILPHYYDRAKPLTVGDLYRMLADNIRFNPDVEKYPVLVDTEARCFSAHMFGITSAFIEGHPEKHLGLGLHDIGSQRVNRDEHIDLVKMCVAIEKLEANDTQTLAILKAQATELLEYYRWQVSP